MGQHQNAELSARRGYRPVTIFDSSAVLASFRASIYPAESITRRRPLFGATAVLPSLTLPPFLIIPIDSVPEESFLPIDDTGILVAICTYQESDNVQPMLRGLRQAFPDARLLVVDDNSPDGTADRVRQLQQEDPAIELMVRTDRRGLGSAIVDAMKVAVEADCKYFLNLDADQSHDPAQMPDLLRKAQSNENLDVVIGSRYVPGGKIVGWPLRRRLMSKMVNRFAITFLRLPVRDCSGSMRCYRTQALQEMGLDSLQCTGYAVLEELLVKLNRRGGEMVEVPITFTERELGQSKLTMKEALRSIRFMIRLAFTLGR